MKKNPAAKEKLLTARSGPDNGRFIHTEDGDTDCQIKSSSGFYTKAWTSLPRFPRRAIAVLAGPPTGASLMGFRRGSRARPVPQGAPGSSG